MNALHMFGFITDLNVAGGDLLEGPGVSGTSFTSGSTWPGGCWYRYPLEGKVLKDRSRVPHPTSRAPHLVGAARSNQPAGTSAGTTDDATVTAQTLRVQS